MLTSTLSNGYTLGFYPQTYKFGVRATLEHNKQYHMKVLLNSYHLNGHTLGFHPQTSKLETLCKGN